MDPQPATEGKQVLSDIEQSIQNALALFNSKDLGGGIDQLYVIDDPIVSLHDPKNQDEKSNSRKAETPPFVTNADTEGTQQFYDALPYTDIKMSHESVKLPFLENPIQHTFEEMQRVLNEKNNVFSPRIHKEKINIASPRIQIQLPKPPSPSQQQPQLSPFQQKQKQPQAFSPPQYEHSQPSPEELLNLFSQDLGIILTPNVSPRGGFERDFIENDLLKAKQTKKEKKNLKKQKQPKLSKDKKIEIKKGKPIKSEVMANHDNKMRELMNIYGCGDRMKKPKSDSTLGSKSGVSRNPSMKKLSSVNMSRKPSSVALSRKTKKIKYKITNDLDINFSEGDTAPLEKSSRLSTKRKVKQKTSSIKPAKKQNLKRKLVGKPSTDDVELKLSKSYQNPTRNRNYETYKNKNNHKDFDDNHTSQRKLTIPKTINRKQKDFINLNKKALSLGFRPNNDNDNEGFTDNKHDNVTVLDAIPNAKEHVAKSKPSFPESQSEKLSSLGKQSQVVEQEKNQIPLNKKPSEERRLNKQVSTKDYHSYRVENKESSDFGNEPMMEHPTQFHFALPTQSSRSKEVERFLNGHYQHLPFVIGQSTNKSHNLWVNIQEALSLIKQNIPQPIEVHGSHDKDSDRPLSVMSKLTTKSSKRQHQCPALMHDGLYDIPETSAEVEGWEDHPDCIQANLDPNYSRPRCSCLPQATLSYKKVLRQIFGGGDDAIDLNRARDEMIEHGGDNYTAELRKVLIAFTQEFEDLNNKYEELLADPNSSKEELTRLEMYLETKEEEIREIIARINEVKELNERSQGRGLEPYKSTTSVQLWQTLRRVQQFKEDILSKPSTRHTSRMSCVKGSY